MSDDQYKPRRRSSGALKRRRERLPWSGDREFRILSIDGGGIRGVFPAAVLAGLEQRYLDGQSLARYFDLITGTSTGGIIALGLGAGLRAADISRIYIERGGEIFPPGRDGALCLSQHVGNWVTHLFRYRYDRAALDALLMEVLGERKFGESLTRLCIPSFDGHHGEVYIFKTPHHPDFKLDGAENMTKVAAATAAAPTFFRPLEDGGYAFVDGGVWANNPVMLGLVDALSCFEVTRHQVSVLSLGCGTKSCSLNSAQMMGGGLLAWRGIMETAMSLQSQNALGQAGLLIGAERLMRLDVPMAGRPIELDDWKRSVAELVPAAEQVLEDQGCGVAEMFLSAPTEPYRPPERPAASAVGP